MHQKYDKNVEISHIKKDEALLVLFCEPLLTVHLKIIGVGTWWKKNYPISEGTWA